MPKRPRKKRAPDASTLMGRLQLAHMERSEAYAERNRAIIALARLASLLGWHAGRHYDDRDTVPPDYRHTVVIDFPTGEQLAWHIGPTEWHLLDDLPVHPTGFRDDAQRPNGRAQYARWPELIPWR